MKKLLYFIFFITVIVSCKNDPKQLLGNSEELNEIELKEIKNPSVREFIQNRTKKLIDVKITFCEDCKPKMLHNDTLGGITKFNEDGIYFNKYLAVKDYSIIAYRIDFKEKNYNDKLKNYKKIIFHWKFNNEKSREEFINHIEFYNRALGKFKEESKVVIYKDEIVQNQYFRL